MCLSMKKCVAVFFFAWTVGGINFHSGDLGE